jgi:hypothetical protein
MIGDNGNTSWCVAWCPRDSSDPRMTSGIASRDIALTIAGEVEARGDQVVFVAEAKGLLGIKTLVQQEAQSESRSEGLKGYIAQQEQRLNRAVAACRMAYRKHHKGDESIGWDELTEALSAVLHDARMERMWESYGKEGVSEP